MSDQKNFVFQPDSSKVVMVVFKIIVVLFGLASPLPVGVLAYYVFAFTSNAYDTRPFSWIYFIAYAAYIFFDLILLLVFRHINRRFIKIILRYDFLKMFIVANIITTLIFFFISLFFLYLDMHPLDSSFLN